MFKTKLQPQTLFRSLTTKAQRCTFILNKGGRSFSLYQLNVSCSDSSGSWLLFDYWHELKMKWYFLVVGVKRVITLSFPVAIQTPLSMLSYQNNPAYMDSWSWQQHNHSLGHLFGGGEKGEFYSMLPWKVTFYFVYSASFAESSQVFLTDERYHCVNVSGRNLDLVTYSGKWLLFLPPEVVSSVQ